MRPVRTPGDTLSRAEPPLPELLRSGLEWPEMEMRWLYGIWQTQPGTFRAAMRECGALLQRLTSRNEA